MTAKNILIVHAGHKPQSFCLARAPDKAGPRAELAMLPQAGWLTFDITPFQKAHFSIPVTT